MYDLNSIRRTGSDNLPPRIVIYGGPKIGKSTFGADAPRPIFIRTEDGVDALSVDAFPKVEKWSELQQIFDTLASTQHDYKTVVLDSADWTENILKVQVALDYNIPAFDTNNKALSFGRGGRALEEYWRKIVDSLDYLRKERGMGCIVIVHAAVKRYDDPQSEAYDRYQLDLGKESAAVLTEWCDMLLFANKNTVVLKEKVGINGEKKRGVGTEERFMYTSESPAFKAGSRWSIPPKLPLGYNVLMTEVAAAKARLAERNAAPAAA